MPCLLPKIHERYFFVADIMSSAELRAVPLNLSRGSHSRQMIGTRRDVPRVGAVYFWTKAIGRRNLLFPRRLPFRTG